MITLDVVIQVFSFVKCMFKSFKLYFIAVSAFLVLSCQISLYILDTSPLIDNRIGIHLLSVDHLPCIFLMVPFISYLFFMVNSVLSLAKKLVYLNVHKAPLPFLLED